MRKKINYNAITYFMAVHEAGSITGAARALGVSKSVISKQMTDLETSLQTSLFVRTSKHMLPTRAGNEFYKRCSLGFEQIESAYLDVAEQGSVPQGELRIIASTTYGRYVVLPIVHAFSRRYPACQISIVLSDSLSGAEETWFDVAILTRELADPVLHVRRIGTYQRRIAIGVGLYEEIGSIDRFEQLKAIPFIGYVNHSGQNGWTFTKGADQRRVEFKARVSLNPTSAVLDSILQGEGFSVLPSYAYDHPDLKPKLRLLLPDWSAETGDILAYTFPTRQGSLATRLFVDWLIRAERGLPFPE